MTDTLEQTFQKFFSDSRCEHGKMQSIDKASGEFCKECFEASRKESEQNGQRAAEAIDRAMFLEFMNE